MSGFYTGLRGEGVGATFFTWKESLGNNMSNGAYKDEVLKLYEVIKIDGHKLYIKGYTMANARSEARMKLAGTRNKKNKRWKKAKNAIVSVREVTKEEIDNMIANSVPKEVYVRAGIMEMLRCGLMTQSEADIKLRELNEKEE